MLKHLAGSMGVVILKKGLLLGVVLVCSIVSVAYAGEIQYARLKEVRGTDMVIRYGGPGGEQYFVCSAVTTECQSHGEEKPDIFPDIDIDEDDILYSKRSPNGKYVLVKTATNKPDTTCACETPAEITAYVHTLYDIVGEVATQVAVLPYTKNTTLYKFSWDNNQVGLFGKDGELAVYDITSKTIRTITMSESGLYYRTFSPHAKYVAAYHSVDREHRIWNTHTGERITIPGKPSGFFMDFSYDETMAVFLNEREEDGVKTMYLADIKNIPEDGVVALKQVFEDDFIIADYLFLPDGLLYVIGNTAENPYNWVLYQYNPETEAVRIIQENVSYGGYVKQIGENSIQFLVIEGKNTNVALYNTTNDEVKVIRAVEPSPASENIKREVMSFEDGVYGVLYRPKNNYSRRSKLFVWLHGGPIRQTSVGYHSYGAYANIDELLERLVDAGSYVLKVDFAGSYGYGQKFTDALEGTMGLLDVQHVVDATQTIQRKYGGRIKETYLIGLSYGGYLGPKTLVDYQRYFDGAFAINGVFDWLIWLEEHPKADMFKRWFYGMPELEDLTKNFDLYKQASIIKGLPDLGEDKTMWLIYGENDKTIPPAQTREFFYLAKSLDKDVRLLKIEDEGHTIQRRENLNLLCQYIADEVGIEDVDCGNEEEVEEPEAVEEKEKKQAEVQEQ